MALSYTEIRKPTGNVDPIVAEIIKKIETSQPTQEKLANKFSDKNVSPGDIAKLTKEINAKRLGRLRSYVLSTVYPSILSELVDEGSLTHDAGRNFDPNNVMDKLIFSQKKEEKNFIIEIVDKVLKKNFIDLGAEKTDLLVERLVESDVPLPLGPNQTEPFILKQVRHLINQKDIPEAVEYFCKKGEIHPSKLTEEVKERMVRYLLDRGVEIPMKPKPGFKYDEYFALAYDHAVEVSEGKEDPIDTKGRKGSISTWDFSSVDYFEDIEAAIVSKDNCLAAGVLDYCYEMGHRMGIYRIVDAVVVNWSAGLIDVASVSGYNNGGGEAEAKLYRYWKLMDDRMTSQERGMVIKRVLNKGNTEVLSRMVVNKHFAGMWQNLMTEIVKYIDKSEKVEKGTSDSSPVSRMPIYQAVKELQFNLSDYCTGMAHMQAREMYAQLTEAVEILRDPEITAHFGSSRRKSLLTTIEMISKAEFKFVPNISAIRTAAVEGNRVFQFIANFDGTSVREEAFQEFLRSAQEYIIAKGGDSDADPGFDESDVDDEFNDEFDDEPSDEFGDEFGDDF